MRRTKLRVKEARRIHDPNFPEAVEHIFTVSALDLPQDLPLGANPREQNTNKQVYREVRDSLLNESDGEPNAFLGKNLGIFACAESVEKVQDSDDEYILAFGEGDSVLNGLDGILNGGHTATIIWDNQPELHRKLDRGQDLRQFVRLYVRVGYPRPVLAEMAGTLNTTVQVQQYSLAEHQDRFEWLHKVLDGKPYSDKIAFKENVNAPYFVTDILSILELFNTTAYPNVKGSHPTGAYREKSQILKRYLREGGQEQYERLAPILPDILELHDIIAMEGRDKYNQYYREDDPNRSRGRGADLAWVENRDKKAFEFPFIGDTGDHRLNRAAIFPALAAFRWMVDDSGSAIKWKDSFSSVKKVWDDAGPEMMKLTQDTSIENGRKTLAIGKSATHYNALHSAVAKHQLMGRA
jgi:hypothetical protein